MVPGRNPTEHVLCRIDKVRTFRCRFKGLSGGRENLLESQL
jgi:hypothetical protein